jgi:5'-deoxynucleotidase
MKHHFFAYLSRMKLIRRWSLMRSILPENIQEHSYQTAIIVHALALLGNKFFSRDYNAEKLAALALYHDAAEVIVGDAPTPVKYFNAAVSKAYGEIEFVAKNRLINMLPSELRVDYRAFFFPELSPDESRLIKAADKIAAYLKCLEESTAGNKEFSEAEKSLRRELAKYEDMPEVAYFLLNFAESFLLTLDEMR